jgi:FkbM family methyltransferase
VSKTLQSTFESGWRHICDFVPVLRIVFEVHSSEQLNFNWMGAENSKRNPYPHFRWDGGRIFFSSKFQAVVISKKKNNTMVASGEGGVTKRKRRPMISTTMSIVMGAMFLRWMLLGPPPELSGAAGSLSATDAFTPKEINCASVDKATLGKIFLINTTTSPSFQLSIHNPKTEKMSQLIARDGIFESEILELAKESLLSHEGSYLLDIGGNLGLFSLLAASLGRHTYTFEPFPINWNRFCHSVELNGFGSKVHLFNVPLGNIEEDLLFHFPSNNFGAVGTVPIDGAKRLIWRNATKKDIADKFIARRLDRFASVLPPPSTPVVLKVDVEGSECPALLGGMKWLEKANIVWAVIEMSGYAMRLRCYPEQDILVKMLERKGLRAYYFDRSNKGKTSLLGPIDTSTWASDIERWRWMHTYQQDTANLDLVWKK